MCTTIKTDGIENVYASNWRILYFYQDVLGSLNFNEMCFFIINKFSEADIIKIERNEEIIKIHFPTPYSYADILRKTEQCRYQIIVDIDIEEETKMLIRN